MREAPNVIPALDPTPTSIFQISGEAAGANLQTLDRPGVAKRRAIPRNEPPARPPAAAAAWLTASEVAALLRVRNEKILHWVRDGRLLAVNVAADGSSRPRWRISRAALESFLAARSNRANLQQTSVRRRRRPSSDDIEEFF